MIDITSPEFELIIQDLFKLARGDFDLVEEGILESLIFHPVKLPWWNFWTEPTGTWSVDIDKASKYIVDRRKKLEEIELADDLNK